MKACNDDRWMIWGCDEDKSKMGWNDDGMGSFRVCLKLVKHTKTTKTMRIWRYTNKDAWCSTLGI